MMTETEDQQPVEDAYEDMDLGQDLDRHETRRQIARALRAAARG